MITFAISTLAAMGLFFMVLFVYAVKLYKDTL
jgi:hypothetical protein